MRKGTTVLLALVLILPLTFAASAAANEVSAIEGAAHWWLNAEGDQCREGRGAVAPDGGELRGISWYGTVEIDANRYGMAFFPTGPPEILDTGEVFFADVWTIFTLPKGHLTPYKVFKAACHPKRVILAADETGDGILGVFAQGEGVVYQYGPRHDKRGPLGEDLTGAATYWTGTYILAEPLEFEAELTIYPAGD